MAQSPSAQEKTPAVSVIVPVYRSESTLARCLERLAGQTYRDFETLLIDSSPTDACAEIVAASRGVPGLRSLRRRQRLWPQAARQVALTAARAELIVFTDPDTYATPEWLACLVETARASGHPVVGSIACFGRRYLDLGIHLCKFSKWLPGGPPRPVDMGPTANLAIRRAEFERAGGFGQDHLLGDVTLSWSLQRSGARLEFEPRAVVEHHHADRLGRFLAERYRRGRVYGALRLAWQGRERAPWPLLLATLSGLRLATNLAHTARHAARAGELGVYAATLPVIALGHALALAGEARAYLGGRSAVSS